MMALALFTFYDDVQQKLSYAKGEYTFRLESRWWYRLRSVK